MNGIQLPLDIAAEALQAGWTKERVIAALVGRIARDKQFLSYRQRSGRRTVYDEMTESDLNALALAACWLVEDTPTQ